MQILALHHTNLWSNIIAHFGHVTFKFGKSVYQSQGVLSDIVDGYSLTGVNQKLIQIEEGSIVHASM